MVKDLLYPLLQAHNPIFTSQQALFTVFNAANSSGKNKREKYLQNEIKMIKMIKRDWKLPNPSYFTYTSIVQQILQANNLFLQFLVALISSRFEAGKTATK